MVDLFDYFYKWINEITGIEFAAFFVTAALIIFCTAIFTKIITVVVKKFLTRDKVPLPSMSIYLNIARFTCWFVGIAILLATCFRIDITGFIAALGVGGIAVSLGFKDTIANLISGVQVTSCKIMKPGDHVEIGKYTGIVKDTSWRHTILEDMYGEDIIVPNSIINSNSIVKLQPFSYVRCHIQLHSKSEALKDVSHKICNEVRNAIKMFGPLKDDVSIKFSSIADGGAKGAVIVKMLNEIDSKTAVAIKDTIIKTIAPYVEAAKE